MTRTSTRYCRPWAHALLRGRSTLGAHRRAEPHTEILGTVVAEVVRPSSRCTADAADPVARAPVNPPELLTPPAAPPLPPTAASFGAHLPLATTATSRRTSDAH